MAVSPAMPTGWRGTRFEPVELALVSGGDGQAWRGRLHQRLEEPPVGERLGVPLDADREARTLDALDRSVARPRGHAQPVAEAVDRLVVEGVDGHRPRAQQPGQAAAVQDLDLVGGLRTGLRLPVAGQVLVQRAAAGDVE